MVIKGEEMRNSYGKRIVELFIENNLVIGNNLDTRILRTQQEGKDNGRL